MVYVWDFKISKKFELIHTWSLQSCVDLIESDLTEICWRLIWSAMPRFKTLFICFSNLASFGPLHNTA